MEEKRRPALITQQEAQKVETTSNVVLFSLHSPPHPHTHTLVSMLELALK